MACPVQKAEVFEADRRGTVSCNKGKAEQITRHQAHMSTASP